MKGTRHPQPMVLPDMHPTLSRLMAEGKVRWCELDSCFVGTAADGVEVSFGGVLQTSDVEGTEDYLAANPTPETW